jgi:O-antigen biosynthesis protein
LTPRGKSTLRTAFHRAGERRFSGFAVDTASLAQRFAVEILVDGCPIKVLRSDEYVHQLVTEAIGDGYYGFSCVLSEAVLGDGAVVEARLANVSTVVGAPIALPQPSDAAPSIERGTFRWLGGLKFSGTIVSGQEHATANVFVDGTLVTRVQATKWTHVGTSEDDASATRAFDFWLPEKFADGKVHTLSMTNEAGEDIVGKNLSFLAYPDGLRELVAARGLTDREALRAEIYESLMPMSVPFSEYRRWCERFPNLTGPSVASTCAVIFMGHSESDAALASLNEQTHADWVAAALTPQGDDPFALDVTLAQEFLGGDGAECNIVIFALAGTLFKPTALQQIAAAFAESEATEVIYCDIDLGTRDGSRFPLALPAFDYERMLEQGYCALLFAMRRAIADRLLSNGPSNLYRLFNSFLDEGTAAQSAILHLPGSLGTLPQFDKHLAARALTEATNTHLKRRGVQADASPHSSGILPATRVVRAHKHTPTTVIIPTRNRHSLLRSCIETIWPAVERSKAEVLIVDNDSSDPDTLNYLKEIESVATILRVPADFNFPLLNNRAVEAVSTEVVCLLNNDIKALDDLWLDEMLSRIEDPEIGAVGALLVWPSGVVQHGGVVLGPSFAAAHAFNDRIGTDVGYGDLLRVAHECSAVTAACMVTRRRDYLAVGGMDETWFPVNFNDVDYCLKLRATGKRVLFTPHAKLVHLESASRGSDVRPDQDRRFQRELSSLRSKWGEVLAADPYYNPILSRDPIPYSGLAWPPGPMEPRINRQPAPRQIPLGF